MTVYQSTPRVAPNNRHVGGNVVTIEYVATSGSRPSLARARRVWPRRPIRPGLARPGPVAAS